MVLLLASLSAHAQRVPKQQIPPSVLMELQLLENRFAIGLAMDCAVERCFSKGCTYIAHATADQPKGMSLPGLGLDPGPGSVVAQEYLTRARCNFAHEESTDAKDVQALARRLQSKLSQAYTVVSVGHQVLPPIPQYLLEEPEPELIEDTDLPEPVEEPDPEVIPDPEWTLNVAVRELWTQLLPHFWWMIGLGLVTLAATLLIWAWRRVGQATVEEQMLMAQLSNTSDEPEPDPDPEEPTDVPEATMSEEDLAFVARENAVWMDRLAAMDPSQPDPQLQALIRDLLRAGELPLLAKAVLHYPDAFPRAFPNGGEIASAKLALADYLKEVDSDSLPDDATFFRSLNRHALAASLASQSDAEVVRGLREEFGASGLSDLIERLPPRAGALLFALAPSNEQAEMVRLVAPERVGAIAEQLLRSNRMDEVETGYLFEVLAAVRNNTPLPEAPPASQVSDRGPTHDATSALSMLLPQLNPTTRAGLFQKALDRFNGSLPSWYRGIFFADMLFELPEESRADLMLEIDVKRLSSWFSLLDVDTQERLSANMPNALRASLMGSPETRAEQLVLAEQGRRDLAEGFQRQLARYSLSLARVLGGASGP